MTKVHCSLQIYMLRLTVTVTCYVYESFNENTLFWIAKSHKWLFDYYKEPKMIIYRRNVPVILCLRGYCTHDQKLAYLKFINTFLKKKNNICILKQIVQLTQKWHYNFSRSGVCFNINQSIQNINFVFINNSERMASLNFDQFWTIHSNIHIRVSKNVLMIFEIEKNIIISGRGVR